MRREGLDETPTAVLDRRLASGEIDRTEYEAIRRAMSPRGSPRKGVLPTSWLTLLVVALAVVGFAAGYLALTYGPMGTAAPDGGGWPWGGCCGMGGNGGTGGPASGYDVAIVNYAYGPRDVRVSVGETVTWVNMDHVMHTVSFGAHGDHDETLDSGPMNHMDVWSATFDEPGTYEYHCEPHPYMTGTVVVEG